MTPVQAGVTEPGPDVPGPGEAELPAPSVAALLRRNAERHADRPAVRFDEVVWSHAQFASECRRWAGWLAAQRPDAAPGNVGLLAENTPTYLAVLGGAALAGLTVVGLNDTRRGAALARDVAHTDVGLLVVQADRQELLAPIRDDLDGVRVAVTERFAGPDAPGATVGDPVDDLVAARPGDDPGPGADPPVDTTWCLVLTSGTTSAPKAVICSQRRMLVTGERMRMLLDVTPDDVGYISMPLFHSNSLMVGLMPALVAGASVGLARRFTASGWLHDVRRYGATWFNYTGKPLSYILATPERPDDADNPVRRAFGNEGSPEVLRRFAERFDVRVIDMFGPTEGGIGLIPDDDTPPDALGRAGEDIAVVDEDGVERPPARFDADGGLVNADDAVGEIVNTAGSGPFEGYYNDPEANARATRNGWYWTGDLGYVDEDGFLYFAGRTSDWIRVEGENFPAGPIRTILERHPDVVVCAVYGVPDAEAGDQVMATLVLRDGADFDPAGFARWLERQEDLGPKWRPRYVRIADDVPRTATNKIIVRELQHDKFRHDRVGGDSIWVRPRGADTYEPFTREREAELAAAFAAAGRRRFYEL